MPDVSPVLQALYRGDHEAVDVLRLPAAELDLFEAAALGEAARVAELLDAEPALVGELSPDGFTALHLGAFFGRDVVVELLLERGAPPGA